MLCLAWAIGFWAVFFVYLSRNVFEVPMGLEGAIYPALFWPYVLVGALLWEMLAGAFLRSRCTSQAKKLFVTLWVPFLILSVLLVLFCPMDGPESYLSYILSHK